MAQRTVSAAHGFSVSVRTHESVDVLRLAGALDGSCAWQLARALGQVTNRVVVIDLADLDAIDGRGLAMILEAKRDCDDAGQFLMVRNAHGMVRQVLRTRHLDDLLVEEKAVAALADIVSVAQASGPTGQRCRQAPGRRGSRVRSTSGARAGVDTTALRPPAEMSPLRAARTPTNSRDCPGIEGKGLPGRD